MKMSFILVAFCLPVFAFGQAAESSNSAPQDLSITHGPPMLGIHWARGFEPAARLREAGPGSHKNPDMTNHGGKIMPSAVTKNIFWGTSWGSYAGDKITGLDTWYEGFNGSNYAI